MANHHNIRNRISIILLIVGLGILAFFPVSEAIDTYRRTQITKNMDFKMAKTPDTTKRLLLTQAKSYNARLAGRPSPLPSNDIWPYQRQLSLDSHNTAFAYIQIPHIHLKMPIYHGTSEEVLSAGVGHLQNTSLPVGGKSTHCVLSAHSGMQATRAFDDIRRLRKGDVFIVTTACKTVAYKVYKKEVVLPNEVDRLNIIKGEDICTLVTCTPYGINTHRLLVHGKRCPVPKHVDPEPSLLGFITDLRVMPFVAALIFLIGISIRRHVCNKKKLRKASS